MNKGFTLIEIIIYVSLLSLLMMSIFSSATAFVYNSMNQPAITPVNYELLIENYHED
ncbi:MAG: hypothetical protein QG640_677 [Patescibacteria group bacterium]|nr:hypothetical protein [Patescibacteria group bacterium]